MPSSPATNEDSTSYFKFDTRLDYYMQLAESSSFPDDDTLEAHDSPCGPLPGDDSFQDSDMVDSGHASISDPQLVAHEGDHIGRARQQALSLPTTDYARLPAPVQPHSSLWTPTSAPLGVHGGRRSYFGPTSYVHLAISPSSLWNPARKPSYLSELYDTRLLVPVEQRAIEDNLVNCFFTWDNFFLDSFDRNIYERDKRRFEAGHDPLFYSPALGYAILAVGSLHSSEIELSAMDSTPEDLASRARRFLNEELDTPSVSTILTLIVLCSLSLANALDDQGWYYSGVALRLIGGLGLDQKNALSHPEETRTTLQLLQGCIVRAAFCVDTIWRSWCSRLSDLSNSHLPDTSVDDASPSTTQDVRSAAIVRFVTLQLIHRNMLSHLAQGSTNLIVVQQALEEWKLSCPEPDSQQDDRTSAMAIQSLIHYHGICINLNRSWNQLIACPPSNVQASASFSKCIDAALEISRLQHLFRQRHGLRRLHPLSIHPMLAGSLITAQRFTDSMAKSQERKQLKQSLLRGVQVFGEIGETMDAGSRALVILMAAQRES